MRKIKHTEALSIDNLPIDNKKVIILAGSRMLGKTTLIESLLFAQSNDIEIVTVDTKEDFDENKYFANEALKLKYFPIQELKVLTDKKGRPLELPKSKFHK